MGVGPIGPCVLCGLDLALLDIRRQVLQEYGILGLLLWACYGLVWGVVLLSSSGDYDVAAQEIAPVRDTLESPCRIANQYPSISAAARWIQGPPGPLLIFIGVTLNKTTRNLCTVVDSPLLTKYPSS